MPTTTPQPRGAGRTIAVIFGAIAGFVAVGLLIAGGVVLWANHKKDDDGYLSTSSERFSTSANAIATDNLHVKIDAPGWIISQDHYGKVRLKVKPRTDKPVFVGIAPTRAVSAYLGRTAHETVTDLSYQPFRVSYSYEAGDRRPALPDDQRFWAASAQGTGRQTVTWDVRRGDWSIIVMNADGSAGVDAGVSAGARLSFLAPVGWSAVGGGAVLLVFAGGLMYAGLRTRRTAPIAVGEPQPAPA
ncbi:MAG TPA: hypothetical protein VH834_09565 [Solirubrobacteraceae bacterium]